MCPLTVASLALHCSLFWKVFKEVQADSGGLWNAEGETKWNGFRKEGLFFYEHCFCLLLTAFTVRDELALWSQLTMAPHCQVRVLQSGLLAVASLSLLCNPSCKVWADSESVRNKQVETDMSGFRASSIFPHTTSLVQCFCAVLSLDKAKFNVLTW